MWADGSDPEDPLRYEEVSAQYQGEKDSPEWSPVRLGFGTIDAEIKGVSAGRVLGIAARTSVGKTLFMQSIEENFARRSDAGQMLATLEVTGADWFERSLAIRMGTSIEEVEHAAQGTDKAGFYEYCEDLFRSRRNTRIVEHCSLEDLPSAIRKTRAQLSVPLRLVMIDYLGLLEVQGRDAYERASKIGKALKQIAKAESVAIIVAIQLSRAAGDGSQAVSIEMLRDSGVLEESLDFLLGCWRPSFNQKLNEEEREALDDILYVKILKNRRGHQGRRIELRFHEESRRLTEIADPFRELGS